jgi:hypothetical protein
MCTILGGHGTFLGTINSFVHIVMYLYYFITNTWPQYKNNIWWKKYVTQLQMVSHVTTMLSPLKGISVATHTANLLD